MSIKVWRKKNSRKIEKQFHSRGTGMVKLGVDHNYLRFSTIFGKNLPFFSKTNVMIKILHTLAFVSGQIRQFFCENI
jgi:hypothetical protein